MNFADKYREFLKNYPEYLTKHIVRIIPYKQNSILMFKIYDTRKEEVIIVSFNSEDNLKDNTINILDSRFYFDTSGKTDEEIVSKLTMLLTFS